MVIDLSKEDISWLHKNHPDLELDDKILRGEVSFNREYNGIAISSTYSLEINLIPKPESILPSVKEIGGDIKEISQELDLPITDLHINSDETICLCIDKKEREHFPNKFTIQDFFEKLIEPYLYWVSYYKKYKQSPWNDYAHGELGHLELYAEGGITLEELKKCITIERLLSFKKYKGHHLCPCGSCKKLRDCHELLYNSFYKLKNEFHG